MTNLWLLTSAINTDMGVFSADERLAHTMVTIDSIRRYDANARVAILEMGKPLNTEQQAVLQMLSDDYLDFTEESEDTRNRYGLTNTLMTVNELVFLQKAIAELVDASVEHIFKLSGRYHLTEDFNLSNHKSDKVVVLERKPSWIEGESMYMSRLFSWPRQLTEMLVNTLEQSYNHISSGRQGDIENMLFKFLPQEHVLEIPKLGVHGRIHGTGNPMWD